MKNWIYVMYKGIQNTKFRILFFLVVNGHYSEQKYYKIYLLIVWNKIPGFNIVHLIKVNSVYCIESYDDRKTTKAFVHTP